MSGIGIRARVFLATMAVIACLLGVTHWVMHGLVNRILDAEINVGLARARQAQTSFSDVRRAVLLDQQRILVAEDNPINQRVLGAVLARAGWPHSLAPNGEVACEKLAAEPFDLVLMDCQMPVLDGMEATRRIRAGESGGERHLPIVALTANAFEADREACLAAGMDDFMAKPFEAIRLVALLDALLAGVPGEHS